MYGWINKDKQNKTEGVTQRNGEAKGGKPK
jgi:hypothetical protein